MKMTNIKAIGPMFVVFAVVALMTGTTTSAFATSMPQQILPSCVDPTGHNLPCMMIISTLPPPANAVQCQESSSQILSCSYATQNLSNGQQVAVITVYVPANFVFSSPTVIKVVVHETVKEIIVRPRPPSPPQHTPDYNYGFAEGLRDGKTGVYDSGAACSGLTGKDQDHCIAGYHDGFLRECLKSPAGCGDAILNKNPPTVNNTKTTPTINNNTKPTNSSSTNGSHTSSNKPKSNNTSTSTQSQPQSQLNCAATPNIPACAIATQTLIPSTTSPTPGQYLTNPPGYVPAPTSNMGQGVCPSNEFYNTAKDKCVPNPNACDPNVSNCEASGNLPLSHSSSSSHHSTTPSPSPSPGPSITTGNNDNGNGNDNGQSPPSNDKSSSDSHSGSSSSDSNNKGDGHSDGTPSVNGA